MTTSITSTALDFSNIKAALIEHLENQTEFEDYNFSGSALSVILDVLAYNTHYNGLTANFALNESFINTAQLRSTMISHAQNLGYDVRSKSSAIAHITIDVTGVSSGDRSSTITLPIGTALTTTVDGNSFVFETREQYSATDDGSGNYSFLTSAGSTSIPVYEGTQKSKTFYAGAATDENLYVIPDANMDTSTVLVDVYTSRSSSTYNSYTNITTAVNLDATSRHYILRESPNGFYEMSFGDGVLTGLSPSAGEKIVVNYLNTKGLLGNEAEVFSPSGTLTVGSSAYAITATTVSNSAGGANKESIQSIRKNAPASFATQNRLVTAEDYRATILSKYSSSLEDVAAWGGESHVPKTFGKVFVSLKFPDGTATATKTSTQAAISINVTDPLSMMSIDTSFIDPETTYIETITTFNFNPNKSGLTQFSSKDLVNATISTYFATNITEFSSVFRRSNILTELDDLDNGILNSKMVVKVQRRFEPTLAQSGSYTVDFPVELQDDDDEIYIVSSSTFTLNADNTCYIRNKLNTTTLEVVNGAGDIVVDNIGSYSPSNATVDINGFAPTALYAGLAYVKMSATPANQSTIRPLRNYVLELDADKSFSVSNIDYEEISVTL
jgi:hypothetical protein